MTTEREPVGLHDEWAGRPAIPAGVNERALPTPSTPGYTYFTDYLGNRWTCCVCVRDFLTYAQKVAIKRGLLKRGLDIWQLTGGATDSAGTHSQGGAFDLLYQTSDAWVKFFRDLGATATWRRTTAQGFSKVHTHGVLNGCPHNAPARYQVTEQKSGPPAGGGDGLTGSRPDYHADPNPYRTWSAGVEAMKKELGLLALTTTTTLTASPLSNARGGFTKVAAKTTQPGASFVSGWHAYDYFNATTETWLEFTRRPVIRGVSEFFWAFGASHPIRARFVASNATLSKASASPSLPIATVDMAALMARISTLKQENAALKAKIAAGPPAVQ